MKMSQSLFSKLSIVLTVIRTGSYSTEIPEIEGEVSLNENGSPDGYDRDAESERVTKNHPNRITVDLMNAFFDHKIHRRPLSELESLADENSTLPQDVRDIATEIVPDVTDDTIREILKGICVDMSKPCVIPSRKPAPKESLEEVVDDCRCILF